MQEIAVFAQNRKINQLRTVDVSICYTGIAIAKLQKRKINALGVATMDFTVKNHITIRKLRLVTGFALIGSVVAGVVFGWVDTSFDPRAIGITLGAVTGVIKVHLFS